MNYLKTIITVSLFVASTAQSAVVIQPTTLTTVEDGPAVQYRVFLDSAPSASENVTITPTSLDSTEGSVGSPIQFDTSNWDVPQYISVTPGASGDGNDGNVSYTISNVVSSNQGGGNYSAAIASDVLPSPTSTLTALR